jgi:ACS family hexuronate transporter-like MFS transporter
VATVSGLSGTGSGLATIVAFYLIGHYSDLRQATTTHAFDPIVIVAGLVPLVGMILVLLLVRNTEGTRRLNHQKVRARGSDRDVEMGGPRH